MSRALHRYSMMGAVCDKYKEHLTVNCVTTVLQNAKKIFIFMQYGGEDMTVMQEM